MKVLHVVRRYGPVGGMERYVWELTRELRNLGHEVEVLCEVCLAGKPNGHDRNAAPDDETCHASFPDGTTSHSTRLPKDGNQVAGYLPNPLDETTSHSTRRQTTAAKSLVISQAGNPHPNPLPEGEGSIALSPSGGKLDRGLGANESLREFHVNDIAVNELGEIARRPRWLSLLRFGWRAARWLNAHPHSGWLIHSHERINVHHVTTFHGPPFANVFERPFWRLLSIRVMMQLYLERRELTKPFCIVPNSQVIRKQLAHYYPQLAGKLAVPIVPGVQPGTVRTRHTVPASGGIIGFVGKEWQRKGLPFVVEIVAHLRRVRHELELWVIGPQPEEIQHLFAGWQGGYRLLGWREQSCFAEFDVLLHPAKAEPYGMVISEAMAACVPVVVSDVCGAAAQITPDAGAIVPLGASVERWADEVEKQLCRSDAPPQFARGWNDVAREYETIYRNIFETDFK